MSGGDLDPSGAIRFRPGYRETVVLQVKRADGGWRDARARDVGTNQLRWIAEWGAGREGQWPTLVKSGPLRDG